MKNDKLFMSVNEFFNEWHCKHLKKSIAQIIIKTYLKLNKEVILNQNQNHCNHTLGCMIDTNQHPKVAIRTNWCDLRASEHDKCKIYIMAKGENNFQNGKLEIK